MHIATVAGTGVFIVQGSVNQIFEELVRICEGLKRAKILRIDRIECEIEGRSKTSLLTWSSHFQVGVHKDSSGVMVIAETLLLLHISISSKTFSKHIPSSKLQTQIVKQTLANSELDRRNDLVMPDGGRSCIVCRCSRRH